VQVNPIICFFFHKCISQFPHSLLIDEMAKFFIFLILKAKLADMNGTQCGFW